MPPSSRPRSQPYDFARIINAETFCEFYCPDSDNPNAKALWWDGSQGWETGAWLEEIRRLVKQGRHVYVWNGDQPMIVDSREDGRAKSALEWAADELLPEPYNTVVPLVRGNLLYFGELANAQAYFDRYDSRSNSYIRDDTGIRWKKIQKLARKDAGKYAFISHGGNTRVVKLADSTRARLTLGTVGPFGTPVIGS